MRGRHLDRVIFSPDGCFLCPPVSSSYPPEKRGKACASVETAKKKKQKKKKKEIFQDNERNEETACTYSTLVDEEIREGFEDSSCNLPSHQCHSSCPHFCSADQVGSKIRAHVGIRWVAKLQVWGLVEIDDWRLSSPARGDARQANKCSSHSQSSPVSH